MVQIGRLRAEVEVAYDRLGLPSWPDPHPGGTSPANEEYSRVTAPQRYRIVQARAAAWVEHVSALPGIEVEPVEPAALDQVGQRGRVTRAVRLSSTCPGTLPLLLVTTEVPLEREAGTLTVLHLCAAPRSVVLGMLPDCGCDACDSGSQDLLGAVDDIISDFVSGPTVLLRGSGWYADWRPGGGASGGDGNGPDHRQMMELCRRLSAGEDAPLPEGTEAFVGRRWLD